MSFLFDEGARKAMKWIWGTFAVLIILSMVAFYAPGLIPGTGGSPAPAPSHTGV